jgi:hypothetical protein
VWVVARRGVAGSEQFVSGVRAAFGASRRVRNVTRLAGGTNKGVYRLGLDNGSSVLGYCWNDAEDFWPLSFYDDGPFAVGRRHGHALFTKAHARLEALGVRVPHVFHDDGHDTVIVEDLTAGTLEKLLNNEPDAGPAALNELRELLDRMHASTSIGIGHDGDDFAGLTCEAFAIERGRACLTEAARPVPRVAAAHADLDRALRSRAEQVTPRSTHRLIHGELGPDHVMIDDNGHPVLIDIDGITYFDVEWEHAFLELRFGGNYERLRNDRLDPQRLALYRLVHYLSLATGPLILLDGHYPHRDFMQHISDVNIDRALATLHES